MWNPPARFEKARQDLFEMKRIGVEAIRTPLIKDERLYQLSDSLGLILFQDLPFEYLSSAELIAAIDEGTSTLESALSIAFRYSSARYFGLTSFSNTSVEASCRFLEELVDFAETRYGNRYRFYYSTYFIEQEMCSSTVDVVLLDVLNDSNLPEKEVRWANSHPNSPMGLANLGTWIRATPPNQTIDTGYLHDQSPEFQARFLENTLNEVLIKNTGPSTDIVFVYRWRDKRLSYPSSAHNLSQPYRHPYGLQTSNNQARHSYDVLEGIYKGNQQVFAFQAGEPRAHQRQWITLCIWLNLLILSFAYAYFPRFRLMARRYFTAHGFFREAIREGRELLIGPNILIFVVISSAFGLCSIVILDIFRKTDAFSLLLRWVPESVSFTAVVLLAQPLLLFVVVSGTYGLLLSFWTSALSAISTRSKWTLLPGQAFMLVLWSQWPLLIAMIGAGVVNTMPQPQLTKMAFFLSVALLVFIATGMLFTLRDYWFISKANAFLVALSLIINPLIILLITFGYYCIQYADRVLFALHVVRIY